MLLTFIYPHDDVFAAVKQESSLFSIRQTDKDGNPMFESLVFDEAYLPIFRELFFNARAELISILSAYWKEPEEYAYFERRDFSQSRDFVVYLEMPNEFKKQMTKPIEDYLFSFLKNWIMYKWLETKMPNIAATFLANCVGVDGFSGYKGKIKSALNSRENPVRRHHELF